MSLMEREGHAGRGAQPFTRSSAPPLEPSNCARQAAARDPGQAPERTRS